MKQKSKSTKISCRLCHNEVPKKRWHYNSCSRECAIILNRYAIFTKNGIELSPSFKNSAVFRSNHAVNDAMDRIAKLPIWGKGERSNSVRPVGRLSTNVG